jgi:hypothetical protein
MQKKEGSYIADISALGGIQAVEPLDLENYADNKGAFELPKKGRYTVQAPEAFPAEAFGRTKAGALSAQVDPTIVGPTNEGFQLRFTKVSAKQFQRGGVKVSQLGDYLRACGVRGTLNDEQEQADAVEATANLNYTVDVDWRAYNSNNGFSVEGMGQFPTDGNGGHLQYYLDESDPDENGDPRRLPARVFVARYIAAE